MRLCVFPWYVQRMAAMKAVRGFKVRIIVSTDVMARGVDFDRVNLVVNVDLPPDAATYVHRVGRTGRFGSRGIAVALVTQRELQKLQKYLADVKGGKTDCWSTTQPIMADMECIRGYHRSPFPFLALV